MRVALWIGLLAVGSLGCSGKRAAAAGSDGTLVLELGGAHSSLREALLAAGQQLPPAQTLRSAEPEPEPESVTAGASEAVAASGRGAHEGAPKDAAALSEPARQGAAGPAGPAGPTAQWYVVTLGPRQTLIHLAKKYLGDGNRFREILELNGWTEADTRRLQTGTRVKIPREAAARR